MQFLKICILQGSVAPFLDVVKSLTRVQFYSRLFAEYASKRII